MTDASQQCHNKNDFIQFRIEAQLKQRWKDFLREHNLNQSDLFRRWISAYMEKHAPCEKKESAEAIWRFDGIVEDMPLRPKLKLIEKGG